MYVYLMVFITIDVTADQSPSIQRILATNADLSYSSSNSNGNPVNGIYNGNESADVNLHTVFLELSEKHMAEQLTRLDTVSECHSNIFPPVWGS